MTVQRVLATKGHDILTIQPHRTLAEAAGVLGEKRIGALLVTGAQGELLGILSERDLVRAIGKEGAAALAHAVSKHMTAKVVTTTPAAKLDDVMVLMTQGRFRHVPVMNNGKLAGLISIGDVVKHRVADIEADAKALRDYIAMA
jgi:CBS domain-containing protein